MKELRFEINVTVPETDPRFEESVRAIDPEEIRGWIEYLIRYRITWFPEGVTIDSVLVK